jgi:hypothetical protein
MGVSIYSAGFTVFEIFPVLVLVLIAAGMAFLRISV